MILVPPLRRAADCLTIKKSESTKGKLRSNSQASHPKDADLCENWTRRTQNPLLRSYMISHIEAKQTPMQPSQITPAPVMRFVDSRSSATINILSYFPSLNYQRSLHAENTHLNTQIRPRVERGLARYHNALPVSIIAATKQQFPANGLGPGFRRWAGD